MANVSEAAIPAIPSKMKKQRLQNADIFAMMTMAFFVITFVLKALTDGIFVTQGMKGAIADSKYLTMGGTIFLGSFIWFGIRRIEFSGTSSEN